MPYKTINDNILMKTIVCGPPHSGKSVLVSNLVRLMPTDSFQRITANGDGEGTWSNNPNQEDVKPVRYKSSNSPQEFANWHERIVTATQDIVLVDVGGKIQADKSPLFDACDSFIVISNDPEKIKEWMRFGEQHNCTCLACLNSVLDGQDRIYDHEPYLLADISGLERGRSVLGSPVLQEIAEVLVTHSNYKHSQYVDVFEIGKKLGCGTPWFTRKGVEVTNLHFKPEIAKALHDYCADTYSQIGRYKIIGAKVNWVACIVSTCLCTDNVSDISFYDEWTDTYIQPAILEKCDNPINEDLEITIKEKENEVLLSFRIKSIDIDVNNFPHYQMPKIDESKKLFISGRFPNWFTVSILKTYGNRTKYLHQPGLWYICVESANLNKLGNTIKSF